VVLLLGAVDMCAGYYLWRISKPWAVIAVAVSLLGGVMVGSYLEILALAGAFTFLWIATAVVKIGLIGQGWKHLR